MAVRIDVRTSGRRLAAVDLVTREDMRQVGLLVRERIVRRTRSGKDVQGRSFAAYKPAYRELKRKALGGSGRVNLTVSGRLLNELQITGLTKDSVTVGWK